MSSDLVTSMDSQHEGRREGLASAVMSEAPAAQDVYVASVVGERSAALPPTAGGAASQPPIRGRELAAIALLVVLCDLTIYRGQGFAGLALLFAAAPLLLVLGSPRPSLGRAAWIVGAMLLALAARAIWCGSALTAAAGFALLAAFALSIAGRTPHVLETIAFALRTVPSGAMGLRHYERNFGGAGSLLRRAPWLSVLLPLAALAVFGTIFVLANPDLATALSGRMESLLTSLGDWLKRFSPFEILFWLIVAWVGVGLLRPILPRLNDDSDPLRAKMPPPPAAPAPLYPAFRNTLAAVIALFAVYLAFEFRTLWFREFPRGFHYSGYAHEGAAWLTFALALATALLSLVFRGATLRDPRLPRLRRLAWIWSAENFLLALAVYNRLFIYVHFNGMSRMRIVGLFGMTAVAVGFALVLWKIAKDRDFVWLLRRHLWTLALAAHLFALTPVDAIVVSYNVRRILDGDPAPAVQISVHPISSEGALLLKPLLGADDAIIREGVRAMLAERQQDAESLARERRAKNWTAHQMADAMLFERLRADRREWADYYADDRQREAVLNRFHAYAYQWY